MVHGLAGGDTISFQNCNNENEFLRHQNFILKSHVNDGTNLFQEDASFKLKVDVQNKGYYSFESANYPGYFIRHQNFVLKISQQQNGSQLFRDDSSFLFDQEFVDYSCYRIQSSNYQDYFWGETDPARIVLGSNEGYRIVKSLSENPKAISFQSCFDDNLFLRHQNFQLKLQQYDNSDLFRNDASFYIRSNFFFNDWYSFESVNYPNHFIRHANYFLKIDPQQDSDLYRHDASFRFVNRKFFLSKKNLKKQQKN